MRRIEKRLNIQKANLLTEQRYMEARNGIIEGPTTDIAGVTDDLLQYYKQATDINTLDALDAKVYFLVKKTLLGHGADAETQKNMYLTLANKVEALSHEVQDPNLKAGLETKAKSWREMVAKADVKHGNTTDLINHVKSQGGLQEKDEDISPDSGYDKDADDEHNAKLRRAEYRDDEKKYGDRY